MVHADVDGDGTADTADGCPADGRKVVPGLCGCGAAETPGCGDVRRCSGGLVIGISLDSSGSIGSSSFEVAKDQVCTIKLLCYKKPGFSKHVHVCISANYTCQVVPVL